MSMKRFFILAMMCAATTLWATAGNTIDTEPLKLVAPEMTPQLVKINDNPFARTVSYNPTETERSFGDFDFFKTKTNPDVKPFKVMDDLTFVGVPLFIAGWAIKSEKNNFKQDSKTKSSLLTNFKTGIDDYTQYFGPALTVGLKLGGYESRSDWPRLLASAAMSYGIMAGFVNGIKYTAKEMRPDGSSANSWPSGHTATSFVGATLLHKEYGLTRSPWFSVAGYGVATATGVMRILNNRHWISDVMSGAGICIMSTELGYALSDVLFKGKGLLRNDLESNSEIPSFFSISMGVSLGLKDLSFPMGSLVNHSEEEIESDDTFKVDFQTGTAVDAEGAYFFNKYVGIGGRLRVRAMTANNWNDFVEMGKSDRKEVSQDIIDIVDAGSYISREQITREMSDIVTDESYTIESDHLTEFSANVGIYFNIPLSSRFALGTKALIGRTMTQELDIKAHYIGQQKEANYTLTINDGNATDLEITNFSSSGKTYDVSWDYMTMGGNNSTNFGTGLSLTYRYKSNFSWKVFVDYDYSEKTFTLEYDPLHFTKVATPNLANLVTIIGFEVNPYRFEVKKNVNLFTIGGSFAITF